MDLSKLPKLSHTPPPPPPSADVPATPAPQAAPAAVAYCGACGSSVRYGSRFCPSCGQYLTAEPIGDAGPPVVAAALSIIAGLFLLFISPRFLQWVLHVTFGTAWTWQISDTDGSALAYNQSMFIWEDVGPFAFAIVLIIDGVVLLALRKRPVLFVMLGLTAIVALYNLGYLVATFSKGFAAVSFLAAAFGALMCVYQWRLIQMLPRKSPAPN